MGRICLWWRRLSSPLFGRIHINGHSISAVICAQFQPHPRRKSIHGERSESRFASSCRLFKKAGQQGRSERPKIVLPRSLVYFILGMARMSPPLRASNRVSLFLFCTGTPSHPRELPDWPSLRASNEHRVIVRVLRARRTVWQLPSEPSETARCASTGDLTGHPSLCWRTFSTAC